MKLSFRWYWEDDPVTLEKIRQIPNVKTIVSAVYDVPQGEVWSSESITALKNRVESAGMKLEVIESVPVHEDIKLGLQSRDRYIDSYIENIRRLGKAGVKVICYNFMPVFDWMRTELGKVLEDGSFTLAYYKDQIEKMNPTAGEFSLPGWDSSYKKEELAGLLLSYAEVSEEKLWENLEYFLKRVIPAAEEANVKMAIHPDDPPWRLFGLPRIITCEEKIDRLLSLVDSEYNGLTLCTGSLGCASSNDMVKMAGKYAAMGRIHFAHMRNVKILQDGSFEESAHFSSCGSLDMVGIMKALFESGFDGYIRPDHGRMIWGEQGRPGYGLYDRALGASYLSGIWETLEKTHK